MGNICCRIFKEQIDLINQLPENERATVLYAVINDIFNQFENQNDNQIENQNENAYVSVSDLGKSIYNILCKNITCKEFSNNYGGRRQNAGAKKKDTVAPLHKVAPTEKEVLEYARQQNEMAGMGGFAVLQEQAQDFYDYYTGIGWVLPNDANTPIRDWRPLLRKWVRNPKFQTKQEQDEESSMDKYEFRSWFDERNQKKGGE